MLRLIQLFIFLLPFHALLITFMKCKLWINVQIIRFWKEAILLWVLAIITLSTLKRYKWNIGKLLHNNYILWTIISFVLLCFVYIFIPFFHFRIDNFLGFRYDVFFLLALLVWYYTYPFKQNLDVSLRTIFSSIGLMLIVFLPWYLIWDISNFASFFGYSSEVSTYNPNACIAFAQNVSWHHRFQWTFGGPIRFSVFLVVFYYLFLWYFLKNFSLSAQPRNKDKLTRILLLIIPSIFVITSIFFAYSKTSILWFILWGFLFLLLYNKYVRNKKLPRWFFPLIWGGWLLGLWAIVIIKRWLFLHIPAMLNRVENLQISLEMFLYNPIGYWLWAAGPASVMHQKFLPENWYIQIFLETWILWWFLFISILLIIWSYLFRILKIKKDTFSIWLFVWFITLCFMALFTHAFEEAATSYILFMIIWAYIANNLRLKE